MQNVRMANLIWLRADVIAARAALDVWATERWRGGDGFLPSSDVRVLADAQSGGEMRVCDRSDDLYDAEHDRYDRRHDRCRPDCHEALATLDVERVVMEFAEGLPNPWASHVVPMLMHCYPRCGPYERGDSAESYRADELIAAAAAAGIPAKHRRQHVRRVIRSVHRRVVLALAKRLA